MPRFMGNKLAQAKKKEWERIKTSPQIMEMIMLWACIDFISEVCSVGPSKNCNIQKSYFGKFPI